MPELTEEFLRKRCLQIVDQKTKQINVFNKDAEESFPKFKPSGETDNDDLNGI